MRAILDFIYMLVIVVMAQATVTVLAFKHRTHVPLIIPFLVKRDTNRGRTIAGAIIVLNIGYLRKVDFNWGVIKKTVYHEYRHVWQMVYHTKVFTWWCAHRECYKGMYRSEICSIEADARAFGNSLGKENRVDLLLKYNALWLKDRFVLRGGAVHFKEA